MYESAAHAAVRQAVADGLLGPDEPLAGFVDVDGVRRAVSALHDAFGAPPGPAGAPPVPSGEGGGPPVLHTFAAKAAPLVPVLRLLADLGMGCEVASAGELRLALAAGFAPGTIVLDSPAKTGAEIAEALALGVAVNADNLDELHRIDALRRTAGGSSSVLGIRVNPQIGGGEIGSMSTATATSKFGVAIGDPGGRERVVRAFAERPWLARLHAHVGSQGCSLDLLAAGARETFGLAEEIGRRGGRVTSVDIGGGLPVNFDGDADRPAFGEYARALRETVPGLFGGRYGLVTEFGRALLAKSGFIAARVEYVKDAGGRRVAVTHAGAQVATRTVLMPDAWPLRVTALDPGGRRKTGRRLAQDVAGPCCFAGDVVAHARDLPELEPGDFVVLHDTGAYYFSSPWSYNSLPRPAVHGFTAGGGAVAFAPIRDAQTLDEVVAESGLAHAAALLRPPVR
ncbi:diaminopimelate decarboxylase [Actinomadura sp. WMMB 499]|uniref:diaminopimelate decarboxylase n=1 Tax=Actinomadura sp. WMMB 499 TaxID=1219491 RepID=UPI00124916A6|nr:diaminopimelate decarboxylase [Actinomadura sp. WMMB 499]QFG22389.1 diaminopimelate decarboxylase [Actinomadura sp. WMMB 499]